MSELRDIQELLLRLDIVHNGLNQGRNVKLANVVKEAIDYIRESINTPKHETVEECKICKGTGFYYQSNPSCSHCDAFCGGSVDGKCSIESKCYACNGKPEIEV